MSSPSSCLPTFFFHENIRILEVLPFSSVTTSQIALLNQTFFERPDLAMLVKHLDISLVKRSIPVDRPALYPRLSNLSQPHAVGVTKEIAVSECLVTGVLLERLAALESMRIRILGPYPHSHTSYDHSNIRATNAALGTGFAYMSTVAPSDNQSLFFSPALRSGGDRKQS
jgi:hypothetical protein